MELSVRCLRISSSKTRTHSTRILEALHVDAAHVIEEGVIVRNGGAELVDEINEKGFSSLKED